MTFITKRVYLCLALFWFAALSLTLLILDYRYPEACYEMALLFFQSSREWVQMKVEELLITSNIRWNSDGHRFNRLQHWFNYKHRTSDLKQENTIKTLPPSLRGSMHVFIGAAVVPGTCSALFRYPHRQALLDSQLSRTLPPPCTIIPPHCMISDSSITLIKMFSSISTGKLPSVMVLFRCNCPWNTSICISNNSPSASKWTGSSACRQHGGKLIVVDLHKLPTLK